VILEISVARRTDDPDLRAAQLDRAAEHMQQLTDETRAVAEALYPGTLGEFGLVNALQALARRAGRHSGGRLDVEVDARKFEAASRAATLSTAGASALYRAADEALRNVTQHADARSAIVRLAYDAREGVVSLEVEDDGRGVDMRTNDPLQAGLGLFSAKAVLALAGGELQISSAPGLGTRILARVPAGEQTRGQ
jgi:two-component system NarL family sensor kinase